MCYSKPNAFALGKKERQTCPPQKKEKQTYSTSFDERSHSEVNN
jgi:hypothetical protein